MWEWWYLSISVLTCAILTGIDRGWGGRSWGIVMGLLWPAGVTIGIRVGVWLHDDRACRAEMTHVVGLRSAQRRPPDPDRGRARNRYAGTHRHGEAIRSECGDERLGREYWSSARLRGISPWILGAQSRRD